MENLSKRDFAAPIFKVTLIFVDNFVDLKFHHTRAVYTTESSAQAILLVNAFRPCVKDFVVSFVDENGEKQKYNPGKWDEYVFRMQIVVGAQQANLFSKMPNS